MLRLKPVDDIDDAVFQASRTQAEDHMTDTQRLARDHVGRRIGMTRLAQERASLMSWALKMLR